MPPAPVGAHNSKEIDETRTIAISTAGGTRWAATHRPGARHPNRRREKGATADDAGAGAPPGDPVPDH